jgi:hypothetical protein
LYNRLGHGRGVRGLDLEGGLRGLATPKAEVYGSYGTTRVPEPGSFVLVAVSLLAPVWLGRKRVSAGFAT